jgi:hypothetical protein
MAVLPLQSGARDLQASVKQLPSCPSGTTRSSQHVGSGLVEPGALSGPSRGRALFTRRRPHNVGGRNSEAVRSWRERPRARSVKEGVIAVQSIGHQDRTAHEIARFVEIVLVSGFFSGFTGASSYP